MGSNRAEWCICPNISNFNKKIHHLSLRRLSFSESCLRYTSYFTCLEIKFINIYLLKFLKIL